MLKNDEPQIRPNRTSKNISNEFASLIKSALNKCIDALNA